MNSRNHFTRGGLLCAVGLLLLALQVAPVTSNGGSDSSSSYVTKIDGYQVWFTSVFKGQQAWKESAIREVVFRNKYLISMVEVGKLLGYNLSKNTYILNVEANPWALRVETRVDLEDEYQAATFLAIIKNNPMLLKGSFVDNIDEPVFQNIQADTDLIQAI